jgi:glycosyltransferase involved in cell wall biosynthesis
MADAVLQIARTPALAHELRTAARARSQLFRWEHIAAEHLRCYAAHG